MNKSQNIKFIQHKYNKLLGWLQEPVEKDVVCRTSVTKGSSYFLWVLCFEVYLIGEKEREIEEKEH